MSLIKIIASHISKETIAAINLELRKWVRCGIAAVVISLFSGLFCWSYWSRSAVLEKQIQNERKQYTKQIEDERKQHTDDLRENTVFIQNLITKQISK